MKTKTLYTTKSDEAGQESRIRALILFVMASNAYMKITNNQ